MKKLITTLVLYCLTTGLEAQNEEFAIRGTGVSSSASILDHSVRGLIEPYISWGTNKKHITIAPSILVASNIGFQSPEIPRLTGGRIGYRFWPGSMHKKWAFLISADIRTQRLKDLWNANTFNEQISEYQQHSIKTIELLIENYVGYGLVYHINKSLSVSQGIGLGWYISNLDVRAAGANAHMSDLFDYRGYDNVGLILNARFEINFSF